MGSFFEPIGLDFRTLGSVMGSFFEPLDESSYSWMRWYRVFILWPGSTERMNPFFSSSRLASMMVFFHRIPSSRISCEFATSNHSGHFS